MIAAGLFILFVSLRKVGLDDSGPASALLLLGALTGGFVGGMLLKGKSGWCSSICPLLPIQRLYGQTPYKLVANSHCTPCVGCTKSCYDFNPKVAFLADLNDPDPYWGGYRKLFAAAFPGLVLAFFNLPEARGGEEILELYGQLGLYLAASIAVFYALDSLLKVSTHKVTTLFGGARLLALLLVRRADLRRRRRRLGARGRDVGRARRRDRCSPPAGCCAPTPRSGRSPPRPPRTSRVRKQPSVKPLADLAASRSMASHRALNAGAPEVTFEPEGKHVVAKPGMTLLEAAEAGGLPIESGCRMGVCGADPVCVSEGMEHLSAISDDERSTLDRLGFADNTRMACCARVAGPGDDEARAGEAGQAVALADRGVQLRPLGRARRRARQRHRRRDRRRPRPPAPPAGADRPRRRGVAPPLQPHGHRAPDLRPLGDAGPLPQPGEVVRRARDHAVAEHARALRSTGSSRRSRSARGRSCRYDRLILATGSSSFVPADRGLRRAGHVRAAHRGRRARPARVRPAPRRAARGRGRRRPARARGGLRAAQARAAHRGARARRPAAAAPARRARLGAPAGLPRGARAGDPHATPRPSRSTATAA